MKALLIAVLLVGCNSGGRFADAATCSELHAAFEAAPVSDDPAERRAVGDEFRERFRELNCS